MSSRISNWDHIRLKASAQPRPNGRRGADPQNSRNCHQLLLGQLQHLELRGAANIRLLPNQGKRKAQTPLRTKQRWLPSAATEEPHIRKALRFHLRPDRAAVIKRTKPTKCWRGRGEEGAPLRCWREGKASHCGHQAEILRKQNRKFHSPQLFLTRHPHHRVEDALIQRSMHIRVHNLSIHHS